MWLMLVPALTAAAATFPVKVCLGDRCESSNDWHNISRAWHAVRRQEPAKCCNASELSFSDAHPKETWKLSRLTTDMDNFTGTEQARLNYIEGTKLADWRSRKKSEVPTLMPGTDVSYHAGWRGRRGQLACSSSRGEDAPVLRTFFTHVHTGKALKDGTFLEIGALDGQGTSNTLIFEKCLAWRGLLFEGYPPNYDKIVRSGRTSSLSVRAGACASPGVAKFYTIPGIPSTAHVEVEHPDRKDALLVECGPLGEYIRKLHVRRIDFFSLDVEGSEMHVLESLDPAHVSIGVMIVEVRGDGERPKVMRRMLSRGFSYVGKVNARGSSANAIEDDVFVNTSHMRKFFPCSRAVATAQNEKCKAPGLV